MTLRRDKEFEGEYAWIDEHLADEFRQTQPIAASESSVAERRFFLECATEITTRIFEMVFEDAHVQIDPRKRRKGSPYDS